MMPDAKEIERLCERLQKKCNDRIVEEGKRWHPLEYRARAETIAEETIRSPAWHWDVVEAIGELPQVIITRYDPRRVY
jgi:hypothetical protein